VCNPSGALSSLSVWTGQLTAHGTIPVLLGSAKHTDSPVRWVIEAPTNTCFAYSPTKATSVLEAKEVSRQEPFTVA
jgi:hypothetical protein